VCCCQATADAEAEKQAAGKPELPAGSSIPNVYLLIVDMLLLF